MKVELKKVKFFEAMSEETYAFVAEIFIDGKHAGHAKNDGHGGSTYYHMNERPMAEAFEAYAKTLPDTVYPERENFPSFTVKMNGEHLIDDLFEKWLAEHDKKKQEQSIKRSIKSYAKKAAAKGFPVCVVFKKAGAPISFQAFKVKDETLIEAQKAKNAADSWELFA
jgi:hypothetical protein